MCRILQQTLFNLWFGAVFRGCYDEMYGMASHTTVGCAVLLVMGMIDWFQRKRLCVVPVKSIEALQNLMLLPNLSVRHTFAEVLSEDRFVCNSI
jgi:hypothetical protein